MSGKRVGMNKIDLITEMLSISRSAYFKFKKEKRPIIQFLNMYFNEEELKEYLNTEKMQRLETNYTEKFELFKEFLEWREQINKQGGQTNETKSIV